MSGPGYIKVKLYKADARHGPSHEATCQSLHSSHSCSIVFDVSSSGPDAGAVCHYGSDNCRV